MARFLFCSFALVLLYPSGIDMYLVGLPHIARDLGASEAQLHIACGNGVVDGICRENRG